MPTIADCCTKGKQVDDKYVPNGKTIRIGRLDVYESNPPGITEGDEEQSASERVLLLLPDGFGLAKHNYLLADQFAARGWRVLIPDYYEGTPVPIQLLRLNDPTLSEEDRKLIPTFDLSLWSQSHPPDHVEGLLRELTAALKTAGKGDRKNILNVAGYCFGGKFALRMAGWDSVSSVASFHPFNVFSEDVQSLRCPTYVGLAEFDNMVPPTLKEDLERWATISGEPDERRRFEPVVSVYPGVDHGFAARPDTNDPVVAAQYAKALDDASNFFLL